MYKSLKLAGALLMALVLVACGGRTSDPAPSLTPSLSSGSRVLGVGSVALGEPHEIAFQSIDGALDYGDVTVSLPLVGTAVIEGQNGTFRYFRARVNVTNNTADDLSNLTLLGVALPGLPQLSDSLTFSPIITPRGAGGVTLPDEEDLIRSIKPTNSPNLNNSDEYEIFERDFVAYSLADVTSVDFIADADDVLTSAFGAEFTYESGSYFAFPYGFSAGDIAAGATEEIDLAFRIPTGSSVNSFTFTFLAVQNDTEIIVQAPDEVDLSNPPVDTNASGAEAAFTASPATPKALVYIGPGTRIISSDAAVSAEANKLANVLIAGGFTFGDNSFAETFLLDVTEDPIIFDGGDLNIAFDSTPADGIAGEAIPGADGTVRLIVTDDDGEPVENIPVTLDISFTSTTDETNPNFVPGDFSFTTVTVLTDGAGIAEFANIVLETAGEYELVFTSAGGAGVSANIEVRSGALDSISIPQATLDLYDGNEFGAGATLPAITVSAVDAFGNIKVVPPSATIVASLINANGATLNGDTEETISTPDDDGDPVSATFDDFVINETGQGYIIRFNAIIGGDTATVQTPAFDIGEGAAELVIIEQVATPNKAGEPLTGATPGQELAIQVLDDQGVGIPNRVVTATLNGPGDFISGGNTVDVATDANGIAAFTDLTISVLGNYDITFSVDGGGDLGVNEEITDTFEVVPGMPASLAFTTTPATAITTGDDITAVVEVEDMFGNLVPGVGVLVGRVAPNPLRVEVAGSTSPSSRTVITNASGEAVFTGANAISIVDADGEAAPGTITLRFTIPGVSGLELLSGEITITD